MNFADKLRMERNTRPSVWIQFTNQYKGGTSDIYLFFEGKDDPSFYLPLLRNKYNGTGSLRPFQCNGKSTVLSLIPRISAHIDKQWRALFFVDKDIDDLLGTPTAGSHNLFVTQHYSIENYLVTEEMLDAVWQEILHLPLSDTRLDLIKKKYLEQYERFLRVSRVIMAWVMWARMGGLEPALKNINLSKSISIDDNFDLAISSYLLREIHDASGCSAPHPNIFSLRKYLERLRSLEPKHYIRGKFELWFFVTFFQKAANVLSQKGEQGSIRAVIKTQINLENAVEILASRIRTPRDLSLFLDRWIGAVS